MQRLLLARVQPARGRAAAAGGRRPQSRGAHDGARVSHRPAAARADVLLQARLRHVGAAGVGDEAECAAAHGGRSKHLHHPGRVARGSAIPVRAILGRNISLGARARQLLLPPTTHAPRRYGRERVYLRRRKGIVKYALQHGYALTPVYTFGESRTYYAFPGMLWLRLRITDLGLPACLLFGNPKMPLYPRYDAALLTYVGAPLQLPTLPEPTQTDVDRWHQAYMDALQELFDGNKSDAGVPDAQLEIW